MVQYGDGKENFGMFCLTLILVANCSFSLGILRMHIFQALKIKLLICFKGHTISIAASSPSMAISLTSPIIAIQILFSGFFLKKV